MLDSDGISKVLLSSMAFCINLAAEEDMPDETHESGALFSGCFFFEAVIVV